MKLSTLCLIGVCSTAATAAFAGTRVGIGLSIGVPPPVYVREAPPPRVVERVVAAPAPGYVWVPGHYTWGGNRWIWVTGAWMLPPRPDAMWVDGRMNPQTNQWVDAHWEIPAPPAVVTAPPPAPVMAPPPAPVATASPAPVVVTPAAPVATYEVTVAEPPPPPVQEVVVASPGPGYVWIEGYWGWEHGRRQWYRGHWERPPHGYVTWVAPRWEHRGRDYVFVRGYWR